MPANRAPIGPDAVRAAYRAHKGSAHDGQVSTTCRTCRSYLAGISVAAERLNASPLPQEPTP